MTMLEKIRRKRGLSRAELSINSGVSVRTIEAYEQETKDIRRAQKNGLEDIANILGVGIYAFTPPNDLNPDVHNLFEELCLATNEELVARNDESGLLAADDKYYIECITGTWWFGDYGTPLAKQEERRYAKYFISSKTRSFDHYFAGTRWAS